MFGTMVTVKQLVEIADKFRMGAGEVLALVEQVFPQGDCTFQQVWQEVALHQSKRSLQLGEHCLPYCACPTVNGKQVHSPRCDHWEPLCFSQWVKDNQVGPVTVKRIG